MYIGGGGIIYEFLPPPPADWRGTPSLDELGTGSILGGDNRARLYLYSPTIPYDPSLHQNRKS